MANVLTPQEAATVLRCAVDDPNMLQSLPLIDAHLEQASGRNWAVGINGVIDPLAKTAARMLLVVWHENPGMTGAESPLSQFGLPMAMVHLKDKAELLKEQGL